MENFKKQLKALWKDESAQGATEYILLLVVVIAVVTIFRNQIRQAVSDKMGDIGGNILQFTGDN